MIYPSYMVIMTTLVGLALVRRLHLDSRIGPKAVWILTFLYLSKLAMLFVASKSILWVSAILLLAVSPPVLLYKDKSRTASKMKPWLGKDMLMLPLLLYQCGFVVRQFWKFFNGGMVDLHLMVCFWAPASFWLG